MYPLHWILCTLVFYLPRPLHNCLAHYCANSCKRSFCYCSISMIHQKGNHHSRSHCSWYLLEIYWFHCLWLKQGLHWGLDNDFLNHSSFWMRWIPWNDFLCQCCKSIHLRINLYMSSLKKNYLPWTVFTLKMMKRHTRKWIFIFSSSN